MLGRYRIVRGKRPPDDPLPEGVRIDTRKHTGHVLRPRADLVKELMADPQGRWPAFRQKYLALLEERFREDPSPFQALAELAQTQSVYIGCNCPTRKQPDVNRCHTVLALQFMAARFPNLRVCLPQ